MSDGDNILFFILFLVFSAAIIFFVGFIAGLATLRHMDDMEDDDAKR